MVYERVPKGLDPDLTGRDMSIKKLKEAQVELARRELSRRRLMNFVQYNYPTYQVNWHHKKIAEALERVEAGALRRLMIFTPPRHGKSELVSVQFPAWYFGRNPDRQMISASYSADLAHSFGRQVRNILHSPEYQRVFRTRLSEDSTSKGSWATQGKGVYNAVGVGGSATGKGAHLLNIDDPIKNRQDADSEVIRQSVWDWYTSTARTRLMPGGAIVLTLTRWHDDDLAGRILKKQEEARLAGKPYDEWEIIELPAIAVQDEPERRIGEALWEERYPLEELEKIKADIGVFDWNALYQCSPLDDSTREFKTSYFKEIDKPIVDGLETNCFISIDTAVSQKASADFTGIAINFVDKQNNWYLMTRKLKITPLELIDQLFTLYERHRPTRIGIEKTIFLQAVKPFLDGEMRRRGIFLPIHELEHNQVNKETRIRSLLPRYQSGSVYHIKGECDALVDELIRFPKGVHDDVVDAVAYLSQISSPARNGVVHNFTPTYGQTQTYNTRVYNQGPGGFVI